MEVLALTVLFSLLLALLFAGLFIVDRRRHRFSSAERSALMPLAEEERRPAGHRTHPPAPPSTAHD